MSPITNKVSHAVALCDGGRASNGMNERKFRARKIVSYLKNAYPRPKSELRYKTQFQFVVAVILSAQCTDKAVNRLTKHLFKEQGKIYNFRREEDLRESANRRIWKRSSNCCERPAGASGSGI